MRLLSRRGRRCTLLAGSSTTLLGLVVAAAVATPAAVASPGHGPFHGPAVGSPVVGHVYTDLNTTGTNTVAGFDRHRDGSLTPIPGSPFIAGGAGTGVPIGSQGAIQQTPDGRFLIAADAASDQISVLRILPDGALAVVPGGPVSSGGTLPQSIAVYGNLVYVANGGDPSPNYTGFILTSLGRLVALPGSTVTLPTGSDPGDVLFNSDGTHLAGTRIGTSLIDSFDVRADGRLLAAPGSPFAAQSIGPFGSEFRPTNPDQLFVSNAHAGTLAGTVSAFDVARDGALTSIGASPFADEQTAPCWVAITPDGQVLFTVNTASGTVSSYSIAPDGSLTLIGSFPFSNGDGAGAQDAALTPHGRRLYVVATASDAISGFSVDGGTLTELPSSPTSLPAGAAPFGLVVD